MGREGRTESEENFFLSCLPLMVSLVLSHPLALADETGRSEKRKAGALPEGAEVQDQLSALFECCPGYSWLSGL